MITYYKRLSQKMTYAAFALLISIGFISFTLSGCAGVRQGQADKGVDTGREYKLAEVDEPPRILRAVNPLYPYEAAKEKVEGRVVVQFVVTKEGTVAEPIVIESDPPGVFDKSALDAVYQYIFKPGIKDGQPVDCIVKLPMGYELGPEQETSNP